MAPPSIEIVPSSSGDNCSLINPSVLSPSVIELNSSQENSPNSPTGKNLSALAIDLGGTNALAMIYSFSDLAL